MSDSSRPHGLKPTRLLHPWDFPGKSTGVGCHCLLPSSPWGTVLKQAWALPLGLQDPRAPLEGRSVAQQRPQVAENRAAAGGLPFLANLLPAGCRSRVTQFLYQRGRGDRESETLDFLLMLMGILTGFTGGFNEREGSVIAPPSRRTGWCLLHALSLPR